MRKNKILVTGGAGFIGSHLVEQLKNHNDVLVIDNLKEGKKENISEEVDFKNIDIRNKEKILETVRNFNPDYVFHLAAYNDSIGSIDDVEEAIDTNIKGTVNLLEACNDIDIEKFVYASSGGLSYGEPEKTPTKESANLEPVYPYGVSKTCGTMFIKDFSQRKDIKFAVMRLGSVYGPRANGGVIKNFFEKIRDNEEPIIFGDGSQTRDFIYVSDVVNGLISAAKHGSGIYNLGTETQTSINELLEIIEELSGSNLNPVYQERWEGDIDRCELSIEKPKNELGWMPKTSLEGGLRKCKTFYLK